MNETSGRVEQKKFVSQSEEMRLDEERKKIYSKSRERNCERELAERQRRGVGERVCERVKDGACEQARMWKKVKINIV